VKGNFVFFLGLFAALGISWAGIVIGSNAQLGSLAPYFDESQGTSFPQWMAGTAAQGQLVYRDLGCAACHTQQVRRPGFGSDQERGWGERQSVARDYIYQPYPQLGLRRIGPDLANIGDRKPTAPDEDDLLHVLYAGSPGMPSYRFLFENRRIGSGAQPSDLALTLTGPLEPKPGWEIVPTARARSLVGYLVSMKTTFDYPEAIPYSPPKPEGAEPAKAAAAAPAAGAPAAPVAPAPGGAPAPSPVTAAAPGTTPAPAANPAAAPAPAGSASPTPAAPGPSPAAGPAPGAAATPTPTGAAATPSSAAAPMPSGSAALPAGGALAPAASGAAPPTPTGSAAPAGATAPTPAVSGGAAPAASPTPTPTAPAASGGAK